MKLTILQLNRLAIVLDEAESDFVRVDPTETHRLDGTVVAQVDGRVLHIIDREGCIVPVGDYVRDAYGLTAVVA